MLFSLPAAIGYLQTAELPNAVIFLYPAVFQLHLISKVQAAVLLRKLFSGERHRLTGKHLPAAPLQ